MNRRTRLGAGFAALGLGVALLLPAHLSLAAAGAFGAPWWKGNLHTHSLWSDGDGYPEMIADWYKTHGYNFVVLTDHNLLAEGERWLEIKPPLSFAGQLKEQGGGRTFENYLTRFGPEWVETREAEGRREVRLKPLDEYGPRFNETGRFLILPGYELTTYWGQGRTGAGGKGSPVHLTVVNARHVAEVVGAADADSTIRRNLAQIRQQAVQDGQVVYTHLNHPNFFWSIALDDLIADNGLRFVEIYNGHPLMNLAGDATHPGAEHLWDLALAGRLRVSPGRILYGVAVDDSHDYQAIGAHYGNTGRGWIMVQANFLTPESLLKAVAAGNFYASTGVVLGAVQHDASRLVVEVAAEAGVDYTIQFIGTTREAGAAETGRVLAEFAGPRAEYPFQGDELYVRARIVSSRLQANPVATGDRETAWTQPVLPGRE